jgi:hypothetical protein
VTVFATLTLFYEKCRFRADFGASSQPIGREIYARRVRFTTWNLWAGDTTAKLARLIPRPDVAVLCEVAQSLPSPAAGQSVPTWEWTGTLPDRGVAIASWTIGMERATPSDATTPGRHGLAVRLANGVGVVGLWACPEEKGRSYGSEVISTIDSYESLLMSQPCLLAGDFNLTPGGQADRRAGVTRRLRELGYVSAYHAYNGIDLGDEQPTYFHQFKRDRPFHIDMIFLPEHLVPNIRSVDIAVYDGWIDAGPGRSDHVPVTIELELPTQ